jgi:hypothetical protein
VDVLIGIAAACLPVFLLVWCGGVSKSGDFVVFHHADEPNLFFIASKS